MVAHLAGLTNGLADISSSEVTHVTSLSPSLAILVGKQLDSPSLNRALPALALCDAYYIDFLAGLVDIIDRDHSTESLLGPVEFGCVIAPYQSHLHNLRSLTGDALD